MHRSPVLVHTQSNCGWMDAGTRPSAAAMQCASAFFNFTLYFWFCHISTIATRHAATHHARSLRICCNRYTFPKLIAFQTRSITLELITNDSFYNGLCVSRKLDSAEDKAHFAGWLYRMPSDDFARMWWANLCSKLKSLCGGTHLAPHTQQTHFEDKWPFNHCHNVK